MASSNTMEPSAPPQAPPQRVPPPPSMQTPSPLPPVGSVRLGGEVLVIQRTAPVQWSTGLCGCSSDLRSCCVTFALPCITFGEITEIIDRGSSSCPMNGIIYGLLLALLGCACMYSCFYRNRLRKQYNIRGSLCEDFCIHLCCECCAICQEYRELKIRGFDMSLGWQGNLERQNHGVMAPPTQTDMRR